MTVTSEAEVCSRFGAGRAVIQWENHGAGRLPVNGSVTYGKFLFRSVVDKSKHMRIRAADPQWNLVFGRHVHRVSTFPLATQIIITMTVTLPPELLDLRPGY